MESELFAKVPHRANLVARIPGSGGGPRLCLLSHTDTVLADPAEWRRDPWSGDLVDGEVWGRGALDMKGQVAAAAVTLASLSRDGFRPAGDLIFVAAADEEVGDDFGLQWLVRAHPEAVRCEYALNEGAGDRVVLGGRSLYLCATAEKMTAPFIIRVRGRSGHASMPGLADNALLKAAPLVERISAYRPERRHGPETEGFFRVLTGEVPPADEAVEAARAIHPLAGDLVEPLLQMTFAPTMISASKKRNVIPAVCEVTVDCRLQARADARRRRGGRARGARRRRLGVRADLGAGRDALAARHPALGRDRGVRRGVGAGRARGAGLLRRASPTATGCARRSARSPTASSPRGWTPS